MIIDKISNMYKYFGAVKELEVVYDTLTSNDFVAMAEGKYKTSNPKVRYNVFSYDTDGDVAKKTEYHMKEIDVQIIIKGQEKMKASSFINAPVVQEYSDEIDAAFIESKPTVENLADNTMFALFFPGEPHATGMEYGSKLNLKKVVFKVKY